MTFFGLTQFEDLRDYLYGRMRGAKGAEDATAADTPEDDAIALLTSIRDEVAKLRETITTNATPPATP